MPQCRPNGRADEVDASAKRDQARCEGTRQPRRHTDEAGFFPAEGDLAAKGSDRRKILMPDGPGSDFG